MTSLFDMDENSSDSEGDVDYVPEGNVSDVSISDADASNDEEETQDSKSKRRPRKKQSNTSVEAEKKTAAPVITKVKADDIWKSFLEEVEEKPVSKNDNTPESSCPLSSCAENSTKGESTSNLESPKEKATDIFEFAGETISVSKDNVLESDKTDTNGVSTETITTPTNSVNAPGKRKGLQSVLGTIMNKKQKITTLEKSLIDWKSYKKDEGIEEELQIYNRGKGGFIERQRFLQRSDIRSYEMEREIRLSKLKK